MLEPRLSTTTLLFAVVVFVCSFAAGVHAVECPATEAEVLIAIYEGFGGASTTLDPAWASIDPAQPLTQFPGISLFYGHVHTINLVDGNLHGVLADEVTCLPCLKTIRLEDNPGVTALPEDLSPLENTLEYIYLLNNSIARLPDSINTLKKMVTIGISDPVITKLPLLYNLKLMTSIWVNICPSLQIAPSVATLPSMVSYHVAYCPGVVFPEDTFSSANTKLTRVYMVENNMTTAPDSIAELPALDSLVLFGNRLVSVQALNSISTTLTELHLYNNCMTGNLPAHVMDLPLDNLRVDCNYLSDGNGFFLHHFYSVSSGYTTDYTTCPWKHCENIEAPEPGMEEIAFNTFGPCRPGYFCDGSGIGEPCPDNTYQPLSGQTECLPCADGSYVLNHRTECTLCPDGTVPDATGTECLSDCPPGTYLDGTCVPCPPTTYKIVAGFAACSPVRAGYYTDLDTRDVLTACPKGYKCAGGDGQPIKCDSVGEYQDETGQSTCKTVIPGYYVVDLGRRDEAAPCAPGHFCEGGDARQVQCPADQYQPDAERSACLEIPSGYSTDSGHGTVTECAKGHFCLDGKETLCPLNTYQNQTGQTTCEENHAGSYIVDVTSRNSIAVCPPGYVCAGGDAPPALCPPNSTTLGADRTQCHACPLHTHTEGDDRTVCVADPGYSGAGTSGDTVTSCPAGFSCQGGLTTPVECEAGTVSVDGACVDAPAGTYAPDSGASEPTVCPEGTTSTPGSTACKPCADLSNNQFCTKANQPDGTVVLVPAECPEGSYIVPGREGCETCSADYNCDGTAERSFTLSPFSSVDPTTASGFLSIFIVVAFCAGASILAALCLRRSSKIAKPISNAAIGELVAV